MGSMVQRWKGTLELEFADRSVVSGAGDSSEVEQSASLLFRPACQTQVIHSYSTSPLKIQRPFYPEGDGVCHSVLLHTAGGMVGGDCLQQVLRVHPNAHALVTTAAASKVYRSNGADVSQSIRMQVDAGACLEWLPQALILFDGARYQQQLRVDLGMGARWLGWEVARLGRTVRGERFNQGQWRSHLEIWQNGRPLFIDPQYVEGGSEMMISAHGLAHCPVIGTFIMVGETVNQDVIKQVRHCWTAIPNTGDDKKDGIFQPLRKRRLTPQVGVSQLQSGIICRYRGGSMVQARRWFVAVWDYLRQTYLSRPSCSPRVWC